MFKKYALLLSTALLFTSSLSAALFEGEEARVEIRGSAFFPSSKRFRQVFQDTLFSYGLEATQGLYENVDLFVNMDYYQKKSSGCCCKVDIKVLNSSFGVKTPIFRNEVYEAYVGIGIAFAGVHLKNETCCDNSRYRKVAIGGVLKTGIYYTFMDPYYLNLFVDYIYQPLSAQGHVDIGGVKTGIGLGVKF